MADKKKRKDKDTAPQRDKVDLVVDETQSKVTAPEPVEAPLEESLPETPRETAASTEESDSETDTATVQSNTSSQTATDPDRFIGTTLASKYEIESLVGKGGMGCVYKAKHTGIKSAVAIKILHKHLMSHQGISDRFRLEAQAANKLRHPNLGSVTDYGITDSGEFYIAMDFIQGETLAEKLRNEGKLSIDVFFKVFAQVLAGLRFCHSKGIVHRDIKPSNILLTDKEIKADTVKLVDFGIAKVLPESESSIDHLTQTGELLGSPLYMSPEQCRGDEIDGRTDLYSLSCVMYEALSGKPPFQAKSAIETLMMHCSEPPPALPSDLGDPQLTGQLDDFIVKAMSKHRDDRFTSAEEMEEALASIQRFLHLPKVARQRLAPVAQATTGDQSPLEQKQRFSRRAMVFSVIVCVVSLMFAVALRLAQQPVPPDQPALQEQALDTIKLGVAERKEGDLGASETRLVKGLEQTRLAFGEKSPEYVTALDELGVTETQLAENAGDMTDERYNKAETYLKSAIAIGDTLKPVKKGKNDGVWALQLLQANPRFHLAHIYSLTNMSEADPLFKKGFELIGKDVSPKDVDYQQFFRDYANFLWYDGKEREAAALELRIELPQWRVQEALEAAPNTDFNGSWSICDYENYKPNQFELKLTQKGNKISGTHLATNHDASRIDGDLSDTSPSLQGTVDNGIVKAKVLSTFGQECDIAMIKVGDLLVWKTKLIAGDGDSYIPPTAILQKDTEQK